MTQRGIWRSEAWALIKRAPTGVKALLGSSVVAAAALVSGFGDGRAIFKDVFASPEKQLTELGYLRRDHSEFLLAISNRHVEAVGLFAKIGKRVKPAEFVSLFEDRVYHRDVVDSLIASGAVTSELCPTSGADVAMYARFAINPEKQALLKQLCGSEAVLRSLQGSLLAEEARLAAVQAANADLPQVLDACYARYLVEGEEKMSAAASRFAITSRMTYTERECVLAKLNVDLLMGGRDPNATARAFLGHVEECCSEYNAAKTEDTSAREALQTAVAMLGER
jgi:hypothetical protein